MKKLFISLFVVLTLSFVGGIASNNVVLAYDPLGGACAGASNTSACASDQPSSPNSGSSILAKAIKVLSVIAGVAAVIMIIVAGLLFATSGGDAQSVANARRAVLGAVIGLIVVVLAQGILFFVIDRTAKTSTTSSSSSAGCKNNGTKAPTC